MISLISFQNIAQAIEINAAWRRGLSEASQLQIDRNFEDSIVEKWRNTAHDYGIIYIDKMDSLPPEILYEIMLKTPFEQLLVFCQTQKRAAEICSEVCS